MPNPSRRRAGPTFIATPTGDSHTPDELTLWYDEPAAGWETQALPIGNGPLGAMVFGGVASERLQFNEKTLWTGGPGSPGYDFGTWRAPRPGAVAGVRRRIDREGRMAPDEVAARLGRPKTGFGAYQTFGDLFLDFAGAPLAAEGYRRELSLREAVARVGYTAGGVRYTREYFASRTGPITVRSPFVTGRSRVHDERGHEVRPHRDGDTLTWNAHAGQAYTIRNEAITASGPGIMTDRDEMRRT